MFRFSCLVRGLCKAVILPVFGLFAPLVGAVNFAPSVSYELSETSPLDIVLGDFTNDGIGDMAISMSGEAGGVGDVSVLAGDGSGGFPDHFQLGAADGLGYAPTGLGSGDFNGDSNLDLAVTVGGAGSTDVHVYLGDGTGGFTFSTTLTSGGQSPWAIVSADFNGDNRVDLAVANSLGTGFGVSVFAGNGDGTFSTAQNVAATSSVRATDIVAADFDHDGVQDLAISTMVLLNDGNGGFARGSNIGLSNAVGIAAADLNNDSWTDIAVAGAVTIDVWRNNGDGSFSFDNNYPQVGSQLTAITAVDIDRDADIDLIVADDNVNQVKVFLGDGMGNLAVPQSFATGIQPKAVASADWNGDSFPDIAAPYRNNGETPFVSVLLQQDGVGNPPAGSVQFSGASYSVAENGASALITVTRSGGSFGAISVDYASSDGSATASSDYTTSTGTLDFADGAVSQSFSVPILDDTTYEGNETVSLSLSNVTGGATLGSPASATLTITENDPPPPAGSVQFSGASYSVAENGASALITVTRSGGSFGAISVDYASSDGSATASSDYTTSTGTLDFADGAVSQSFSVPILDDTTYEGNETVSLSLSNVTGGATLGSPASATLTITENDPPPPAGSVQFSGASYSVAENGASALITVTRSGGSFGAISVDYASSDGSATASSDYTTSTGTLDFADGAVSQSFSVPILDDTTYEGNETVSLSLSNVTGGATLGSPASATLTITENDPPPPAGSVQFSGASYSVAENGASALITVTRSGGSFGAISVDYASSDGSATASSDYTTSTGTLDFADGAVSQSFSVPILDDTTYEGNETVSLSLSNVTGGATLGSPASATLTITENDPPPPAGSVQFSGASYSVAENGASALITVTRSGGSFGAISVDYASSDGSATASSDYTTSTGTLDFADGAVSQSFSVPILDDTTYEGNETVSLSLSNVTGGATLGSPASATLTITENDPPPPAGSVQFSGASYSVAENGASALITVTRSGGSFGAISVDYASSDGSATASSDYTTSTGTLDFADGAVSQSFSVPILDDTTYEGNETVSLSLSNVTGGATLGSPASATLTITENDPPPPAGSVQFSGASYSVAENGASALITVTRSGGSFGAISVDYASSDGSATASSDYTTSTGTLDFADGAVSQSFSVPILDDTTYEGNETVSLSLSNVTGGATLGSPASATLTITENDVQTSCTVEDLLKGKRCPKKTREGKGKTCSDGIDNDGDGLIDCLDNDCRRKRMCRVR